MIAAPIDLFSTRAKRRPTRFRAVVEALDPRRLMASGVTGVVATVSGSANAPLTTVQYNLPPALGLGGLLPSPAPIGTPIPLVRLFGPTFETLSASSYSGTVDWGDGSAVDAALFGDFVLTTPLFLPNNTLLVSGPDHTYQTPGNYTITISVTGPGDSAPTVYHDVTTITRALTIELNSSSDSGFFNNDNVTAITTPNFLGVTSPGANVVVSATSASTGQTLVVGTGVADASGFWSVTSVPFADGAYTISAQSLDKTGTSSSAILVGQNPWLNSHSLVIDTVGPKITGFRVTNTKRATFQATFSDPNGLFFASLADPNTYVVNRLAPTPKKGQTFPVISLGVTAPVVSSIDDSPPLAFSPIVVTGSVGTGKPIINGNGVYRFTIHSTAVLGLSGAPLDGEYLGKFPTGNGVPGGEFRVKVNVHDGKPSGPIAIRPITPKATHEVARLAVKPGV